LKADLYSATKSYKKQKRTIIVIFHYFLKMILFICFEFWF